MSTGDSGVPTGGGVLDLDGWLDVVGKDYLGDFVAAGGTSVKVAVVGNDGVADRLRAALPQLATPLGYAVVVIDSSRTRAHLVEQVYAECARQLDWLALAARFTQAAYASAAFPAAAGELAVLEVADRHDVDAGELYRSVRRQLELALLPDPRLPRDLRMAMLRLCQDALGWPPGQADTAIRDTVLAWLRAEPVVLAQLRTVGISGRVARHTARGLLTALGHLHQRAGLAGIVIVLDLARLAVARRPPVGFREGHYYSRAAVLDAYEMLRQLLDAVDRTRATFVVAVLPPELVTDESRGLAAYSALQLRVADEVRDRRRANPYAPMVRLETRLEVAR